MAPSAIAEHRVNEEVILPKTIEILPMDTKGRPRTEDHHEIKRVQVFPSRPSG